MQSTNDYLRGAFEPYFEFFPDEIEADGRKIVDILVEFFEGEYNKERRGECLGELAAPLRRMAQHWNTRGVNGFLQHASILLQHDGEPREAIIRHNVNIQKLVPFPANAHNLKNGSLIVPLINLAPYGVVADPSNQLEIAFDGKLVRCERYTWSVDQLVGEIEIGLWKVP